MLANHIEELETRSEVKVNPQEMQNDLPFFERNVKFKPARDEKLQNLNKDDELI